METTIDKWWVLAIVSKGSTENLISVTFFVVLTWIVTLLLYWAQEGGHAWGKYYFQRRKHEKLTVIPGPRGFPMIGSIHLMNPLAHRRLAAIASSRSSTKRLMAFSLGETRVVMTSDSDVAKEILNSSSFVDRPIKESAYNLLFDRAIGFAPYGDYWKNLRRITSRHLLCPKQIAGSSEMRERISAQMVSIIAASDGGEIRVREILKRASLNNMIFCVFSRKYDLNELNPEIEEMKWLVDEGYDVLGKLNWSDHMPFLKCFDYQQIGFRCRRIVPRVTHFVTRIIEEHRRQNEERNQDFVDVLLSLPEQHKLSDSDMIAVLWEMIFRGTDTVSVLMEWILARLVLHPDIQSQLHEELDRVIGRSQNVTESHLTELTHLHAIVKEVLRLHPPGPLLSWARLAVTDTIVDGRHVPAGTTAMVNMWAIARDPMIWNDPLSFKPERFLSPEFKEFSVMGSDLRLAPFGSGRRGCPGKMLGIVTVTYWIAVLLHEFRFSQSDKNRVDLSENLKLSCEMAIPLTVYAHRRRM